MHTPPWWIEKSRWFRSAVFAEGGLGNFAVAKGIYYDSDARLIAAAPDLHTALAAMVAEASAKGYDMRSMARAKAVLAKLLVNEGAVAMEKNQRNPGYRRVLRSIRALQALRDIESELREQASGEQDGYLLDVANRMRDALKQFAT